MTLSDMLFGRKIIWFVDNEPSKESLVRGFSASAASAALVQDFYDCESTCPTTSWFTRVPSFSNLADMPSRNQVSECAKLFDAEILYIRSITDVEISQIVSRTESYLECTALGIAQ